MCIFLLTAGDKWNIKVKYQLKSRRGTILFKTQIFISRIKQELNKSNYQRVTWSHRIVCSYSVAALVLTIKPRQTNTQCYRVIQLRNFSIQQEELKKEIFT